MQQLLLCATQSLFTCDAQGAGYYTGANSGDNADAQSITTASNSHHNTSNVQAHPSSSSLLDCKTNPAQYVMIQGWQLLSLAVSLFLPRNNRILWYLKKHLQRNADSKWVFVLGGSSRLFWLNEVDFIQIVWLFIKEKLKKINLLVEKFSFFF